MGLCISIRGSVRPSVGPQLHWSFAPSVHNVELNHGQKAVLEGWKQFWRSGIISNILIIIAIIIITVIITIIIIIIAIFVVHNNIFITKITRRGGVGGGERLLNVCLSHNSKMCVSPETLKWTSILFWNVHQSWNTYNDFNAKAGRINVQLVANPLLQVFILISHENCSFF